MDPFNPETVEVYEEALANAQAQGIHVKALLLCNPHNPLGKSTPIYVPSHSNHFEVAAIPELSLRRT